MSRQGDTVRNRSILHFFDTFITNSPRFIVVDDGGGDTGPDVELLADLADFYHNSSTDDECLLVPLDSIIPYVLLT